MENEGRMITDWLDQHGDPEIEKKVYNQIMKDEFRRMQVLAGVITESEYKQMVNEIKKYPKGFSPIDTDEEDNEIYEGDIIVAYEAPMEGWDEEHTDRVIIVKRKDGFYVDGYISFGDFTTEGPFNALKEAEDVAYNIMKDLVNDWKTDLNENFVGMGAINNPFASREKTDYELAFERYSNTLNEEKPSSDLSKKEKSAVVKKARAGKDIGGKGKGFEKVAKTAAKEYGSKEAGKKVAAAAMWKNIKEEEEGENPVDTIMMDVPLFIRMLEYAREDASTDMDLHDVAEKAVTLSAQGEPLNMDSYNDLIGQETLPAEIN